MWVKKRTPDDRTGCGEVAFPAQCGMIPNHECNINSPADRLAFLSRAPGGSRNVTLHLSFREFSPFAGKWKLPER